MSSWEFSGDAWANRPEAVEDEPQGTVPKVSFWRLARVAFVGVVIIPSAVAFVGVVITPVVLRFVGAEAFFDLGIASALEQSGLMAGVAGVAYVRYRLPYRGVRAWALGFLLWVSAESVFLGLWSLGGMLLFRNLGLVDRPWSQGEWEVWIVIGMMVFLGLITFVACSRYINRDDRASGTRTGSFPAARRGGARSPGGPAEGRATGAA